MSPAGVNAWLRSSDGQSHGLSLPAMGPSWGTTNESHGTQLHGLPEACKQ